MCIVCPCCIPLHSGCPQVLERLCIITVYWVASNLDLPNYCSVTDLCSKYIQRGQHTSIPRTRIHVTAGRSKLQTSQTMRKCEMWLAIQSIPKKCHSASYLCTLLSANSHPSKQRRKDNVLQATSEDSFYYEPWSTRVRLPHCMPRAVLEDKPNGNVYPCAETSESMINFFPRLPTCNDFGMVEN